MGEKDMIIGFALIFLFSIGLINFAIMFGEDNSAIINIANKSSVASFRSSGTNEMVSYSGETNETFDAFQQSEITDDSETTRTGSVFKNSVSSPWVAFKLVTTMIKKEIFGITSEDNSFLVIFTTIIGLLLTISALYIWKTWKGGNPD